MHESTHSQASQFAFGRLSVEKRVQLEDGFVPFCNVCVSSVIQDDAASTYFVPCLKKGQEWGEEE